MTSTVIFDMGNVLINFSHEKACEQISAFCGKPASQIFDVLFSSGLEMRYEAGQISRDDLIAGMEAGLGCKLDTSKVVDAACDIFWPKPDMVNLAAGIKSAGYRLVLLSNVNEDHFEYIRARYDFPQLFDELVLSYQVGACKPDDRIYQRAVKAAMCPAGKCLFIDDVKENIDAALRNGIPGIHYRNTAQLKEELTSRKISWNVV
ncbi:MAG: hypothetical protein RIQ81_19 [Pseudomonadota bacterium]|jgi:putative hydrolase of the HAD superfamily